MTVAPSDSNFAPSMAILQGQPSQFSKLSKKSQQCIERLLAHQGESIDLYVLPFSA